MNQVTTNHKMGLQEQTHFSSYLKRISNTRCSCLPFFSFWPVMHIINEKISKITSEVIPIPLNVSAAPEKQDDLLFICILAFIMSCGYKNYRHCSYQSSWQIPRRPSPHSPCPAQGGDPAGCLEQMSEDAEVQPHSNMRCTPPIQTHVLCLHTYIVFILQHNIRLKLIVHPKISFAQPQAIQDVEELVSLEQIWRNFALYHLLPNGSPALNGCRQNESPNSRYKYHNNPQEVQTTTPVQIMSCEVKRCLSLLEANPPLRCWVWCCFRPKKYIIHNNASSRKCPSPVVLSHPAPQIYLFRTAFTCKWCLICPYFSPDSEETTFSIEKAIL